MAGVYAIKAQLQGELKSRGARGIIGLQRKFKIMDDDGSKSLNMSEFKKAMNECNMSLSDSDLRNLFNFFDKDGSGTINFDEFLNGCRDPMNQRRRDLVMLAFQQLDKDGSGIIDAGDIVDAYDTSKHPDVIAGKKSSQEVLGEFLDTFDVGGVHDGKVTTQEWMNYYENISASIDMDDYFELMIRNAWHISGGEGWCANTSCARVLVTHPDGSQTVQEVKNDLGVSREQFAARLQAQGVQVVSIDTKGGVEDESPAGPTPAQAYAARTGGVGAAVGGIDRSKHAQFYQQSQIGGGGGHPGSFGQQQQQQRGGAPPPPQQQSQSLASIAAARRGSKTQSLAAVAAQKSMGGMGAGAGMSPMEGILLRLRADLKRRGAAGIIGLGRKFKIMDDDGSKTLCMEEFTKGMNECSLGLSPQEIAMLFRHFDRDGGGTIGYEEFLGGLRGVMNPRRRDLALLAFTKIDKDASGILDASDIVGCYDASKHPEVIAGRMTEDQVFSQFLDSFDVGGTKDGMVTKEEWVNYYNNVSSSIDDDDYFELMIRNAWHISGGEGWCANSSNARVLVTHADGHQSVEEVKDDLGVSRDQWGARLHAQGVHATKIDSRGGVEDESSAGAPSVANAYAAHAATVAAGPNKTFQKVNWFG